MPILRLQDGTRVRFKEGLDPNEVYRQVIKSRAPKMDTPEMQEKVAAQQAADRELYDPTKGMSGLEKFGLGASAGVRRVGRGIADMAGVLDPEEVAARNQLDEPVLNTGAGKVGNFLGNTAALGLATAPLGALGGAVRGGGALASTLRAGVGNVAAQGALGGAINADPGERGQGAVLGAVLGAGTYGLLKGAGKLASGLTSYSDDAKALRDSLPLDAKGRKQLIPLSHATERKTAPGRAIGDMYELLGSTPGPGAVIQGQYDDVLKVGVDVIGKRSTPSFYNPQAVNFTDDASRLASVAKINDEIRRQAAAFAGIEFKVGDRTWQNTVGRVLNALPDADLKVQVNDIISRATTNYGANLPAGAPVPIPGAKLLDVLEELRGLRNDRGGSQGPRGSMIQRVIDAIQTAGDRNPKFNFTNKRQFWGNINKLFDGEEYKVFKNFERSLDATGATTPERLARNFKSGPNAQLASYLEKTLGSGAGRAGGAFERTAAIGPAVGLLIAGSTAGPAAVAGTIAAGLGMSTKAFQRALVGDFALQMRVAEILRNNPKLLAQLGSAGTAALIPQGN